MPYMMLKVHQFTCDDDACDEQYEATAWRLLDALRELEDEGWRVVVVRTRHRTERLFYCLGHSEASGDSE